MDKIKRVKKSASEEEEEERQFVETLAAKYSEFQGTELLGPIIENLKENIKPGICLICIEDVERKEAIWNCQNCYCTLHLVCIQRWAKDSVANVREAAVQKGFNLPLVWCCPKCRGQFNESEFPSKYTCYCTKSINPVDNPWNTPHSCGEICAKPLKNCEHFCSLICHAGPCPKCPKQVTNSCFCGQSTPKTFRCYSKLWSCEKECSKELTCTFHKCSQICHEGDCPKCEIPITLKCKCSSPSSVSIGCADWASKSVQLTCGNLCGKQLSCNIHKCSQKCHEGTCPPCFQSCPCGKHKVECSGRSGENRAGWEKSCGETCLKKLDCEEHVCHQKCHSGTCGSCLESVLKKCKCGAYEKEVLCSKEFVCTNRCGKTKSCLQHSCNKKCCGGECEPCNKECGKTLLCKNHKCQSPCGHPGLCFPCPVSAPLKCRCGETVVKVPCGSERRAKAPSCSKLCQLKPKCDHDKIQSHRCHFGDCPRCTLLCDKKLISCYHSCYAICHSFKLKKKPCPPCPQLIPTQCTLHSHVKVECSKVEGPCQEECGKFLGCGLHSCIKKCHLREVEFCGECRERCGRERPRGCEHECTLGCHTDPCPECSLVSKVSCHCEAETLFVVCSSQYKLTEIEKSCRNQCIKKLSCGHRCLQICHSGECSESERCRRKVKLSCKCKKFKKEVECFLVMEEKTLECTEGICSFVTSSKSPKAESGTKKRNKKKKVSESDKDIDKENIEFLNNSENEAKILQQSKNTLVALGILGVFFLVGLGFMLLKE